MKIDIDQNSAYEETSVTIRCARLSREVTDLLALLRVYDEKLTGQRGGETHILNAADVLYADTADRRTFFYTAEGVYETELRLYELEQRLAGAGFLRAGPAARFWRPLAGHAVERGKSHDLAAVCARLSEEAGPLRPFVKMNTGGIIE